MSEDLIPIPEGWLDPQFKGGGGGHDHWWAPAVTPGEEPVVPIPGPVQKKVAGAFGSAIVPGDAMADPIVPPPMTTTGALLEGLEFVGVGGYTAGGEGPAGVGAGGEGKAGDSWMGFLNASSDITTTNDAAGFGHQMQELPTPKEAMPPGEDEPLFPPIGVPTLPPEHLLPPEPPLHISPGDSTGSTERERWWWRHTWPQGLPFPPPWWRVDYGSGWPPKWWDPWWPWPGPLPHYSPFDTPPGDLPEGFPLKPLGWPHSIPYPWGIGPHTPWSEETKAERLARRIARIEEDIELAKAQWWIWMNRISERQQDLIRYQQNPDPDPATNKLLKDEAKAAGKKAVREAERLRIKRERLEKKLDRYKKRLERLRGAR